MMQAVVRSGYLPSVETGCYGPDGSGCAATGRKYVWDLAQYDSECPYEGAHDG